MKKILILSSSASVGGNSDLLADEFRRGAQDAGHEVEKVVYIVTMRLLKLWPAE